MGVAVAIADESHLMQLYPGLVRFAAALLGSADEAEDVVQAAIVSLWMRSRKVEIEHPLGYLRTCVTHDAVRRLRHAKKTREFDRDAVARSSDQPEAMLENSEFAKFVLSAVSPRERAALVARFYLGYSEAETATLLGCSVGTVKKTVHRARTKVQATVSTVAGHAVPDDHSEVPGAH